jgi:hypothetical protein
MVDIDEHDCIVDGCTKAYPHTLLRDKHIVDEHEQYLDDLINGDNDITFQ